MNCRTGCNPGRIFPTRSQGREGQEIPGLVMGTRKSAIALPPLPSPHPLNALFNRTKQLSGPDKFRCQYCESDRDNDNRRPRQHDHGYPGNQDCEADHCDGKPPDLPQCSEYEMLHVICTSSTRPDTHLLRHPLQHLSQLSQFIAITGPVPLTLQVGCLFIDAHRFPGQCSRCSF